MITGLAILRGGGEFINIAVFTWEKKKILSAKKQFLVN